MPENSELEDERIIDFVGLSRSVTDSPAPVAVTEDSPPERAWPAEQGMSANSSAPQKISPRAEQPRQVEHHVALPVDNGHDNSQVEPQARAMSDDDIRIGLWGQCRVA